MNRADFALIARSLHDSRHETWEQIVFHLAGVLKRKHQNFNHTRFLNAAFGEKRRPEPYVEPLCIGCGKTEFLCECNHFDSERK